MTERIQEIRRLLYVLVPVISILVLAVLVLIGIRLTGSVANLGEPVDLFQRYKGSYVGDASAVGNIARGVPGGEFVKSLALHTAEPPYGITLYLEGSISDRELRNLMVHQSAWLFALVRNADWITFEAEGRAAVTVTREQFTDQIGIDVRDFDKASELSAFVGQYLKNQK